MIIKFKVTKGKFKPIRFEGEVEAVEDCSICHDENKVGEMCYYLTTKNIQFQICEECFEELQEGRHSSQKVN